MMVGMSSSDLKQKLILIRTVEGKGNLRIKNAKNFSDTDKTDSMAKCSDKSASHRTWG